MRRLVLVLPLVLGFSLPAKAFHCPHGQIYRVHLRQCVSERSALARVAFHYHHRVRFEALPPPRHHRHRIVEDVMHGDPIEDRVDDTPPTQTPSPKPPPSVTPREDAPLPDAFTRSVMGSTPRIDWKLRR